MGNDEEGKGHKVYSYPHDKEKTRRNSSKCIVSLWEGDSPPREGSPRGIEICFIPKKVKPQS
jgi:hypothetical protein